MKLELRVWYHIDTPQEYPENRVEQPPTYLLLAPEKYLPEDLGQNVKKREDGEVRLQFGSLDELDKGIMKVHNYAFEQDVAKTDVEVRNGPPRLDWAFALGTQIDYVRELMKDELMQLEEYVGFLTALYAE